MVMPVVLGALCGLGLWLMGRSLVERPVPLRRALAQLEQPPGHRLAVRWRWVHQVPPLEAAAESMAKIRTGDLEVDLALVDRTIEAHLVQRVTTGLFYGAMPLMFWLVSVVVGEPLYSLALAVVAAAAGLGVGWVVTDWQLRSEARRRRRTFDSVLATYLQLVSIQLTGGAGVNQAMADAARVGEGWVFDLLQSIIRDARLRVRSPWEVMAEYGQRYQLTSLIELAATMTLAGDSGAKVRTSLLSKATVIRNAELGAIEREAASRTTAMVGPTGLMMAGFVVLVIYPAFVSVLDL